MTLLEQIGVVAIGVVIFFIVKSYNSIKEDNHDIFLEKANILIMHHPEIRSEFRDFLNLQDRMISNSYKVKNDDNDYDYYNDGYRGGKIKIFGHYYKVYNLNSNIEKKLTEKIKSLEKSPEGQVEIKNAINYAKQQNERRLKIINIELAEINASFLKYNEALNLILPNSDLKLTREDIIKGLGEKMKINLIDAERAFEQISMSRSNILNEHFENLLGPKTGKYWYSEYVVKESMNKIKKEIDFLTFKYH